MLTLFCDGGSDLESVEHEAGAFAVHGLVIEGPDDLTYGEEDGGGVFERRDLGRVALVHAIELHMEEAIRLAREGGRVAALSIVFDVSTLFEHDFSLGAAGWPAGPPPGGGFVFNGLRTETAVNI